MVNSWTQHGIDFGHPGLSVAFYGQGSRAPAKNFVGSSGSGVQSSEIYNLETLELKGKQPNTYWLKPT